MWVRLIGQPGEDGKMSTCSGSLYARIGWREKGDFSYRLNVQSGHVDVCAGR